MAWVFTPTNKTYVVNAADEGQITGTPVAFLTTKASAFKQAVPGAQIGSVRTGANGTDAVTMTIPQGKSVQRTIMTVANNRFYVLLVVAAPSAPTQTINRILASWAVL
jgi:hypothetical protein